MSLLNQVTSYGYAFVKRNPRVREIVWPVWRWSAEAFSNLKSLATGATILPPPDGVEESVEEWVRNNAHGGHTYHEITPSYAIKREHPKTIDKKLHWKFKANETKDHPTTFLAIVKNGRVYGEGHVITPDNRLLAPVSRIIEEGEYRKNAREHPIFSLKTLPPLRKLVGNVAVLTAASGRGYYHWMFDVLPRIQLIKDGGTPLESIDYFLINNYIAKFHIETLTMLGIPRERILESHWNPHIQAENLIVPSLVGDTGHIPVWACQFLRKEFLPKASLSKNKPRRLYFNRSQVTHRKVVNEAEIASFLAKYGFESIALESLSLADQFSLLAQAEAVIIPHGAGLTNIVFCQPGTKVIELLSTAAVNIMYWTLCNQIGLEYYYLFAEGERPPDFVNVYNNNDSLTINIDKLNDMLALAGIA